MGDSWEMALHVIIRLGADIYSHDLHSANGSYHGVMPTEHDVYQALRGVVDPELGGDIVELGMVTDVEITDGVVIGRGGLDHRAVPDARSDRAGHGAQGDGDSQGCVTSWCAPPRMTRKQRSELMATARRRAREDAEPTQVSPTTRVIAVGSGKGGVGKSSVAVNLAVALADRGLRVGLMDADIWGFSVPRMLGVTDRPCRRRRHPADHPGRGGGDKGGLHRPHHRVGGDGAHVAGV